MLFSGKIYTPETNFTRPPVVTVATNLNSGRTFGDDYADGDDDGRLGVKKRTG